MSKRKSKDSSNSTIVYGSASVALCERADSRIALRWREDGKWRTTTRLDMDDAKIWAKAKAKALDNATGAQWVTPAARQQLEWLRRIAGSAEAVPAILSHLEAALANLDGGSARLPDATRWFAAQGGESMRDILIGEAVSEFLESYSKNHPKITVRGVRSELLAFKVAHGNLPLASVTADLLRDHISRGQVAERTRRNRHSYWILFFNSAIAAHWWPRNSPAPICGVKREKPVRKSPEIFTPEEGAKLLQVVSARTPQHLAYLLVAGWLGCRPFECQRLLWSDVDYEQSLLHVRAEVARKVASERWVPIPARVLELLRECQKARRKAAGKKEHVCRLKAQNSVSEVARSAGLRWSIDVLRHSRITYRLQETRDIGRVAEESGNSAEEIRNSYKRPIPPGRWEKWLEALSKAKPAGWMPEAKPWNPEELALLGKISDGALAEKTGRPRDSIMKKRLAIGVRSKK